MRQAATGRVTFDRGRLTAPGLRGPPQARPPREDPPTPRARSRSHCAATVSHSLCAPASGGGASWPATRRRRRAARTPRAPSAADRRQRSTSPSGAPRCAPRSQRWRPRRPLPDWAPERRRSRRPRGRRPRSTDRTPTGGARAGIRGSRARSGTRAANRTSRGVAARGPGVVVVDPRLDGPLVTLEVREEEGRLVRVVERPEPPRLIALRRAEGAPRARRRVGAEADARAADGARDGDTHVFASVVQLVFDLLADDRRAVRIDARVPLECVAAGLPDLVDGALAGEVRPCANRNSEERAGDRDTQCDAHGRSMSATGMPGAGTEMERLRARQPVPRHDGGGERARDGRSGSAARCSCAASFTAGLPTRTSSARREEMTATRVARLAKRSPPVALHPQALRCGIGLHLRAEEEGFEPTEPLPVRRFSKPVP
jgi:hypothetical protein